MSDDGYGDVGGGEEQETPQGGGGGGDNKCRNCRQVKSNFVQEAKALTNPCPTCPTFGNIELGAGISQGRVAQAGWAKQLLRCSE